MGMGMRMKMGLVNEDYVLAYALRVMFCVKFQGQELTACF